MDSLWRLGWCFLAMSDLICIDPGPDTSGVVVLRDGRVKEAHKAASNAWVLDNLLVPPSLPCEAPDVAIEMIASYGMAVGAEVFETCVQIGRVMEKMEAVGENVARVYRKDVKMHLCGTARANDSTIRQALVDRFGPGKEKAIGTKAAPGPLYGVTSHAWQALAVGITYQDQQQ